jgi:hypothetical protein
MTEIKWESDIVKQLLKSQKEHWFVLHIQEHLNLNQKVICKICNKDIDMIAKERLQKIQDDFAKDMGKPI